jgi:opacity protein-like surface antigen
MLRDRKWICSATSVLLLAMSAGAAQAQSFSLTNFYVSVFGGGASGLGSVSASGYDPECGVDPEWCFYEMEGNVGPGLAGGVAIGTLLVDNLRGEVELSFAALGTTTDTTTWDPEAILIDTGTATDSLTAMFLFGNIWYDIPIANQFTAYVGGGAGVANAGGLFSAPITSPYPSDLSLSVGGFAPAVQVGGGVEYAVAPNVTLGFGYRFKQAFGLPVSQASTFSSTLENVTNSTSMNLGVHVFQVGISFAIN